MKLRTGDASMPAPLSGRELCAATSGLSVNLLVADMQASLAFQRDVLGVKVVYSDTDFAALAGLGAQWCLHADHTYTDHPLHSIARAQDGRGAGAEIRLYGCDPDAAQAAAQRLEHVVLAGAMDKPDGLREVYLLDCDGYCWVPSVPCVPQD